MYLPIREPSLKVQPLFTEVYIAVLPICHKLARQKQITLRALANEVIVFYPRSLAPVLYANFIKGCEQASFVPNIVQEAEQAQTRLGLAAAGVGITFVLAAYAKPKCKRSGLPTFNWRFFDTKIGFGMETERNFIRRA